MMCFLLHPGVDRALVDPGKAVQRPQHLAAGVGDDPRGAPVAGPQVQALPDQCSPQGLRGIAALPRRPHRVAHGRQMRAAAPGPLVLVVAVRGLGAWPLREPGSLEADGRPGAPLCPQRPDHGPVVRAAGQRMAQRELGEPGDLLVARPHVARIEHPATDRVDLRHEGVPVPVVRRAVGPLLPVLDQDRRCRVETELRGQHPEHPIRLVTGDRLGRRN
ncbi:hypothetical protein SH611_15050 [Geminicoccaceae bacterium 1502E]|nr:hypothetical protein [Geminicoccaceae bacterium 1502E]